MKKILITGSEGFIAKNLIIRLKEINQYQIIKYNKKNKITLIPKILKDIDYIFHLAGVNRPDNDIEFKTSNIELTKIFCRGISKEIKKRKHPIKLIYTSSSQAKLNNYYGRSKLESEIIIKKLALEHDIDIKIFQLPGVFGKWSKPNYNSVVSTFCYNASRNLPLVINDPNKKMKLVYIDDVIDGLISCINNSNKKIIYKKIRPEYLITLKKLSSMINSFNNIKNNSKIDGLGSGFSKKLYSTYLSFLPNNQFTYELDLKKDHRGCFVELLKSNKIGQFNYFTINVGQKRGGHYHHTKSEKFIVISGKAKFRTKNIINNRKKELIVSDKKIQVIDTIPGWTHDISNIGKTKLIVLVWVNEIFDLSKKDTFISILK